MSEKRRDNNGRILKTGEYQRKDLTYEYRWTDQKGKRRSAYAPTLADLRQAEARIAKDLLNWIDSSNITVAQLFDRWKRTKTGIKPTTRDNYTSLWNTFVLNGRFGFTRYKLSRVKRSTIKELYLDILDEFDVQISSVVDLQTLMSQLFNLAVDDDLIPRNPTKHVLKEIKAAQDLEEKPDPDSKFLTMEEQARFFDYIEHHAKYQWAYPVMRIMVLTGLRIGEAAALQWSDVDLASKSLIVRHNLVYARSNDGDKKEHMIYSPKSNHQRIVPLTDEAAELLTELHKRQLSDGIKCEKPVGKYKDFVFLNRLNHPIMNATIRHTIECAVNDANADAQKRDDGTPMLPHFSSHWFRHTFATRLFEANVNVKTIQKMLGHANIKITLDTYTGLADTVQQADIVRFDQYMKRAQDG